MSDRLHNLRKENNLAALDMDGMRPRFERLAARHENGTAPEIVTGFNLFPTPLWMAQIMAELAEFKAGDRVLEPSAGTGNLLQVIPEGLEVVACEESPDCARHIYNHHPLVTLKQGDFLQMGGLGLFDVIIMNPPFHMRADIRHIKHAREMLAPGGRLVGVCMDTNQRKKEFWEESDHWQEIEAAFEGTKTRTVIFRLRND